LGGSTESSSFARRESLVLATTRIWIIAWLVLASSRALAQNGGPDAEGRRARLRDGDFQPGDRIVVVTRGDSTSVDTLTVQSDRTVSFQKVPPISLDGVPRAELQPYLTRQFQQYLKRDLVRAIPLVPVGILGEVVHPGYYRVPLQITLGDLLMVAGGPSPQADLTHVRIRRGQTTLVNEHTIRDAMVRGLPLAALGVDAGDEVVLKPAPQKNWLLITQIAGLATGLVLTLRTFKAF